MLPEKLIADFWVQVLLDLVSRHQITGENAAEAVRVYRAMIEYRVGDMIYHRDAEQVAETVADGWKSGFLTASTVPSAATP